LSRKVTRTKNSDGSWSESYTQREGAGCMTIPAFILAFVLVVAVCIHTPAIGIILGLLIVAGVVIRIGQRETK
jgi:hypothetical protein